MKLIYIGIFNNDNAELEPVELVKAFNFTGFGPFTKKSVGEFASLFSHKVAKATKPGDQLCIQHEGHLFRSFGARGGASGANGLCAVLVIDEEYPGHVAQGLLRIVCDDFGSKYPRSAWIEAKPNTIDFPELQRSIDRYQNPSEADPIMKVLKETNETQQVLYKTLESVLERGEKIDSLVAKSDKLSSQSKMFYTQAKKQNSCCVVM